jgi:PAS domain S-box-containing protein
MGVTSQSPMLKTLIDVIEDGICLQSQDGRIINANGIFAELIGVPHAQLVGRTFAEAFGHSPEGRQLTNFLVDSSLAGEDVSKLIPGIKPGHHLRARYAPARDSLGQITGYVVVICEINELSAREREIARLEQRARFGELAAGLAHEIKNPLAGIQGAVDILIGRRSPDDGEREVLEGVRREVGRIDNTVQTLLYRARPRRLNLQPTPLVELIERAVTLAQASLKTAHKEQIQFQIEAATPVVISIDAVQIEDAVFNLLLNAVEAIGDIGSIRVRVYETTPDDETGEVVIEVTDTGRGIAAGDLAQIFSPFYTTDPAGTGLGLSAVRGILRAHGGRVEVSSQPNIGSTFSLRLPRKLISK